VWRSFLHSLWVPLVGLLSSKRSAHRIRTAVTAGAASTRPASRQRGGRAGARAAVPRLAGAWADPARAVPRVVGLVAESALAEEQAVGTRPMPMVARAVGSEATRVLAEAGPEEVAGLGEEMAGATPAARAAVVRAEEAVERSVAAPAGVAAEAA